MKNKHSKYLALLRGINVGGKNIITKDELRQAFEALDFTNVRTYIQSGNILFRSNETAIKALTTMIEAHLTARFSYKAQAVILSHEQFTSIVQAAPETWGKTDQEKHNALFALNSITSEEIIAQLPSPKTEIETVTPGFGVVYWSVSKKHQTKATLMKLPSAPVYQQVTVRNHNTVFKLLKLFEAI